MKRAENNMTIYAVRSGSQGGFNVWLDYSGQEEFVIYHRYNPAIYAMLRDGISLGELRRSCDNFRYRGMATRSPAGRRVRRGENVRNNSLSHLCQVIDSVLEDMWDYRAELAAEMEAVSA